MTRTQVFVLSCLALLVGAALIVLDHAEAGGLCVAAALAGLGGHEIARRAAQRDQPR